MRAHRNVMASAFAGDGALEDDTVDPMSGLGNMADCMLVLALGILLALIIRGQIETSGYEYVEVDVTEVTEAAQELEGETTTNGSGFEEIGMTYKDPETGDMYVLRKKE